MNPALAAMVFPTWQGLLLILLCFGSLLIALYCLLFMVPLKSFVRRIDSLGGGMQGIRAHVDGVRKDVEGRIGSVEQLLNEQLERQRRDSEEAIESVARIARKAEAGIQRLDRAAQSLQADLRETASDARKLSGDLDAMRSRLTELHNDFDVLEQELDAAMRTMVGDAYQKLEGTVLSALESVKDDMLRATGKTHAGQDPRFPKGGGPKLGGKRPSGTSRRGTSDKIISAGSLFAEAEKEKRESPPTAEPADTEPTQPEQQEAPAK